MPKATVDMVNTERVELKTCPGGYVVLKKMPYGLILERRALMKMSVTAGRGQKNLAGEIALANEKITLMQFQACVVEHNLEDGDGRTLNLADPRDIKSLDPKIGAEIEAAIDDRNNFEEEEEQGN